jgi:hypothetical protein
MAPLRVLIADDHASSAAGCAHCSARSPTQPYLAWQRRGKRP